MGGRHSSKHSSSSARSNIRNNTAGLRLIFVLLTIFISLFYAGVSYSNYFDKIPFLGSIHLPAKPQYAYATLLSSLGSNYSLDDSAVTATRVLTYQILHHHETKTQNIPLLVLVTPDVPVSLHYTLAAEGATIIKVDDSKTQLWKPHERQDMDQLLILRLFDLTQFDRILYLSRDTLLTESLDKIWSEIADYPAMPTQKLDVLRKVVDESAPAQYFIAGVSQGNLIDALGSNFLVLEPSSKLKRYYNALISKAKDNALEPGVLSFAHRQTGEMPYLNLPLKWSSSEPSAADLEQSTVTLHGKFWRQSIANLTDCSIVERWWRVQGQMEGYWQAKGHIQQI